MAAFVAILGIMLVLVGSAIFRGITLSFLWAWFVVPLGVPTIGIAWAIGIALIVGFLTQEDSTKNKRDFGEAIVISIGNCLGALTIGYILTLFM